MYIEDKVLRTDITNYGDIVGKKELKNILSDMMDDCVENVSGEISLIVSCGEIVNAITKKETFLREELNNDALL